jgi:malonyl-CoA/methylmalonyl-CoA synthetase
MPGQNLFDVLFNHGSGGHDGVFLEHERATTTYAQARTQSARLAAVLRDHGVTPGARVIVQVAKSPEAVMLYLACLRVGAIFIPLNPAYTLAEVRYFIDDARPRLVVCAPEDGARMAPVCPPETHVLTLSAGGQGSLIAAMQDAAQDAAPDARIAPCAGDDVAAILYTSGTTGRSKGAMLSHANLAANALTLHKIWRWQPGDVLLHALPIFHVHGLFVALHCALLNGSRVIFQDAFDAGKIIDRLPESTVMMGVPTYYTRLLERADFTPETCANMRLFISGSAPLLPETFERFRARSGHTILERYGMTEAGMIASNPYDGARLAGTVGPALPDVTARVCDGAGDEVARGQVGVLEIKGPNVFAGYWQMPEKTAQEFREDGFFITGDMAVMDDQGRISIVGRARDLVISGGFNVYPKEVEIEIDKLDGVAESAVIGVAHTDFGEAVVAVVVADGNAVVDAAAIKAGLGDRLAPFKRPKAVIVVAELPRNTMGKVQKKTLREAYADIFKDQ